MTKNGDVKGIEFIRRTYNQKLSSYEQAQDRRMEAVLEGPFDDVRKEMFRQRRIDSTTIHMNILEGERRGIQMVCIELGLWDHETNRPKGKS